MLDSLYDKLFGLNEKILLEKDKEDEDTIDNDEDDDEDTESVEEDPEDDKERFGIRPADDTDEEDTSDGPARQESEPTDSSGVDGVEEEPAQKEEEPAQEKIEKQYFGKKDDTTFYYLNKIEKGWNVTDAEERIVYPTEEDKDIVPTDDILNFIIEAQKKLELAEISGDIFARYVQPAVREEEKERDKEKGITFQDETDQGDETKSDEGAVEPFAEDIGTEEEEKPITIESVNETNEDLQVNEKKKTFSEEAEEIISYKLEDAMYYFKDKESAVKQVMSRLPKKYRTPETEEIVSRMYDDMNESKVNEEVVEELDNVIARKRKRVILDALVNLHTFANKFLSRELIKQLSCWAGPDAPNTVGIDIATAKRIAKKVHLYFLNFATIDDIEDAYKILEDYIVKQGITRPATKESKVNEMVVKSYITLTWFDGSLLVNKVDAIGEKEAIKNITKIIQDDTGQDDSFAELEVVGVWPEKMISIEQVEKETVGTKGTIDITDAHKISDKIDRLIRNGKEMDESKVNEKSLFIKKVEGPIRQKGNYPSYFRVWFSFPVEVYSHKKSYGQLSKDFWAVLRKYKSIIDLEDGVDSFRRGSKFEDAGYVVYFKEGADEIAVNNAIEELKKLIGKDYGDVEESKLNELNRKGVELRLQKKVSTGEWVVKYYENGKYNEEKTYYTDDKDDAIATMKEMQKKIDAGDKGYKVDESNEDRASRDITPQSNAGGKGGDVKVGDYIQFKENGPEYYVNGETDNRYELVDTKNRKQSIVKTTPLIRVKKDFSSPSSEVRRIASLPSDLLSESKINDDNVCHWCEMVHQIINGDMTEEESGLDHSFVEKIKAVLKTNESKEDKSDMTPEEIKRDTIKAVTWLKNNAEEWAARDVLSGFTFWGFWSERGGKQYVIIKADTARKVAIRLLNFVKKEARSADIKDVYDIVAHWASFENTNEASHISHTVFSSPSSEARSRKGSGSLLEQTVNEIGFSEPSLEEHYDDLANYLEYVTKLFCRDNACSDVEMAEIGYHAFFDFEGDRYQFKVIEKVEGKEAYDSCVSLPFTSEGDDLKRELELNDVREDDTDMDVQETISNVIKSINEQE